MKSSLFSIIEVLVGWIEKNLDQPLSVDDVAKKAGYSKWHLQRLFREVTGESLGTYIRGRKLTKAAVALRLTGRSILDIAAQYQFESQQAFTRSFSHQFHITPGRYRNLENWHTAGIVSPLRLKGEPIPEHSFVRLDDMTLYGNTQSYHSTLENMFSSRDSMRVAFWNNLLRNSTRVPGVIYGLHQVRPSYLHNDEQEVFYSTAVGQEYTELNLGITQDVQLIGGNHVAFTFQGPRTELQGFVELLYHTAMPALGLIRRKGQDIECFHTRMKVWSDSPPEWVHCDYFIPVM